ncbi:inositol polyphosphate 5-phosphatase E [Trichonephila clavata]|uniref:Inositol polyphosphate 5-phosphatase E n=1 Tax=Trichonephila clavata TaxID=2740835 RepID=A0A8X6JK38_TRICU|nr:inositol polyphosphate 5-phosphatase E [Trichonephila clavata]
MFSSLPSASKIYVSSSKSRQKSASSAKKRRRKVHSGVNRRENIAVQSLMNCDQESSDFLLSSDSECRRDSKDSKISQFEREDIQIKKDSHDSKFCKWEREDSTKDLSCQSAKNVPEIVGNSEVLEQLSKEEQNEVHEPEDERKNGSSEYFVEEQNEESTEQLKENNEELENRLSLGLDEQKIDPSQTFAETLNKKAPEKFLVDINESLHKQSEESQSQQSETSVDMNAKENENSEQAISSVPTINSNTDKMQQSNDQASSELVTPEITLDEINNTESHVVEHMMVTTEVKETNETEAKLKKSSACDDIVATELMLEEKNFDSEHDEESFNQNITESLNSDCTVKINDINENFIDSEINFHSEDSVKSILPSFENNDYLTDNTDKESNHSNNFLIKDDTHNSSNNKFEISIIDENSGQHAHTSHKPRIQSPEQSEISCTESLLDEPKSPIQGNAFTNNSLLNRDQGVYDSLTSVQDSGEKIGQKNHLKISQSSADLLHDNMDSLVSNRCFSLPGGLCFSEESQKFDETAPLGRIAYVDKATLTTDLDWENCSRISLTDKKSLGKGDYKDSSEDLHINKHASGSVDKISLGNILPPLAMIKARARSYVFGSKGTSGSLLGNEELHRFFPDNQITIFVGTWNMNSHDPPANIDDFLLPLDINTLPDIYVIGIQESMQSRLEWEVLLQTTLGPSHVLFTSSSLGVLHLCIFLRRDLIWFCSEPEDANVTTRPGSMVKTKGAVAVCFMLFGTSFLFVNSHLTAHEQKLKERLSDYEKIISSIDLPKSIPVRNYSHEKDVTSKFDCVFWCGDLNFRVMHDRPSVLSFVEEKVRRARPSCSFLVKHDQLHQAMTEGRAFHGFKEGVICFIPSYKFDVGTSTFNSSKLRVPSYTDRILYRSKDKSAISCLHYNAVSDILTSDHKPVYAVFKVAVKPGRDNVPLAAGMFRRDVYLEALKRRSKFLEVRHNQGQSAICSIM